VLGECNTQRLNRAPELVLLVTGKQGGEKQKEVEGNLDFRLAKEKQTQRVPAKQRQTNLV
jgi:hypothetical protein